MVSYSLGRLSIVAICVWLLLLLYISAVLVKVQHGGGVTGDKGLLGLGTTSIAEEALQRIKQAANDIEALKRQNEELRQLLYQGTNGRNFPKLAHLSQSHEESRRRSETGLEELWFFVTGEINRIRKSFKDNNEINQKLDRFESAVSEQYRTVMADLVKLSQVDGGAHWRAARMKNLTDLVQKRLAYLQNPPDCQKVKKLICNLNKGCGFGCQIHHASYCFIVAYGTGRTMLLDTTGWRYSSKGWTSVFRDASEKCPLTPADKRAAVSWQSEDLSKNEMVISLPIVDGLRSAPPYLPLSFPADLAPDLLHLHGSPPAWWVGQFVHYLMRPSDSLAQELYNVETKIGYGENPIVGLHVRRTDKVGAEAAFHPIEEYMKWAEHWFVTQELIIGRSLKRRVYLATDDTELLSQTRNKYKNYEVSGDTSIAASAQVGNRYSDSSLHGIIIDIHLLSKCDYLVCTFSSQVCRLAYELMQVLRGDAASSFHSLDDIYYFGGQQGHEQTAWLAHQPRPGNQEMEMKPDDVLGIAGNHWDGYSKGSNKRSSQIGLYPSYKAREKWRIVNYPTYPEVKL